jgi:hypothetical protein
MSKTWNILYNNKEKNMTRTQQMKVDVSGYSGRHSGTGEYGISLYVTVPKSMEPEQVRVMTAAAPDLLAACEAVLASINDPNFDDYFDGARIEVMLKKAIDKAKGAA